MLVVRFSRPGENAGVGVVAEGSTAKLARMVAGRAGAGLVGIVPDRPYPSGYEDAKAVIQRELEAQARPAVSLQALSPGIPDADRAVDEADVIALGYPIWCGHLPMPVRTFLDAHDLTGRTVLPFCTNEGSGLALSVDDLTEALPNTVIGTGLAVLGSTVQRDPDAAQAAVDGWLSRRNPA